jgi:hypothetical protein
LFDELEVGRIELSRIGLEQADFHDDAGGCCGGGSMSSDASSGSCCGGSRKALTPLTRDQILDLPPFDLVVRYRRGIESIDRRVFDLTERQIDQAFLPDAGVGTWPVRVLIGHVADADLASVHRMRRVVGETCPVVSAWDEHAFVDANLYGNAEKQYSPDPEADEARVMQALGGPMAVIHTVRQWASQWLLSLDDSAWHRKALHPERGELTLRMLVGYDTFHLEHHSRFLTQKLDKMLGPVEAAVAKSGGGCGSGCGCH